MNTHFSVSIPKPCHEDWNKMTPNEQGAFCKVCSKTVVDFTSKTTNEIKDFFRQHTGQKICGRFDQQQLKQPPVKISGERKKWFARFALALYMVFGTMLFTSCGTEQHQRQLMGDSLAKDSVLKDSMIREVEKQRIKDSLMQDSINRAMQQQHIDPNIKGKVKVKIDDPNSLNDRGSGTKTMGKPMVHMGDASDPVK
jgi:hypothetical protein